MSIVYSAHRIAYICPACSSVETDLLYGDLHEVHRVWIYGVHERLHMRRCASCGITYTYPQLPHDALKNYYCPEYGSFLIRERRGFFSRVSARIKNATLLQYAGYGRARWFKPFLYPFSIPLAHIPRAFPGGRLLDIGCGSGNYLYDCKQLGWDVHGIDPSPVAVQVAQSRGLDQVREGYIESAEYPTGYFDVISMFHVFEHVPNPHAVLERVHMLLKPGGRLIIGVPNYRSFGSFLYGPRWAGLSFPLHYFHYEQKTLAMLLLRHGFQVERTAYANIFSDIFVSSPESMYHVQVNYKPAVFIKKLFAFLNIIFGVLDYVLGNIIAQATGRGSQITMISKKP